MHIIMDGKTILSCLTLAVSANGHEILTIEGLAKNDPVVEAFAEQCEPGHGTPCSVDFVLPGLS